MPQAFPQTTGVSQTFGASNFSSPFDSLQGLSYSFDYGNSRFVLLDQFTRKDGTGSVDNNMVDQLPWIDSRLSSKPTDGHAFVFAHKELIGQDHEDTLFGSTPAGNPAAQNTFIASLQDNGVRYAIGGHDHMHHRSLVASPDAQSQVQQIITSS
ncbi:MAG: metallophosphoesterase, partial [Gammaproteobacteria bacterium]|nr:metallophosphoesterase [Gammaproteobacteria bacterium]